MSAKLSNAANDLASAIADETGETKGPFLDLLIKWIPIFLPFISQCKKDDDPVPPPVPVDEPQTPEFKTAWDQAFSLKTRAKLAYDPDDATYERQTLHRMVVEVQKQKRKDTGRRVDRQTALAIARAALDKARTEDLAHMADLIVEARQES